MAISSGRAHARGDASCPVRRWLAELDPLVAEPVARDLSDPGRAQGSRQAATLEASRPRLIVQLREKHLDDRTLLELCVDARRLFRGTILVNGRPDLALAADLDGVQLPSKGIPVMLLRARFGRRLVLGVSTHGLSEIEAARDQGADFAVFGPVFETPSKRSFGPPQGLEGLSAACSLGLPVLAIGGIQTENTAQVVAAGASGVAAIRSCATRAGVERLLATL